MAHTRNGITGEVMGRPDPPALQGMAPDPNVGRAVADERARQADPAAANGRDGIIDPSPEAEFRRARQERRNATPGTGHSENARVAPAARKATGA